MDKTTRVVSRIADSAVTEKQKADSVEKLRAWLQSLVDLNIIVDFEIRGPDSYSIRPVEIKNLNAVTHITDMDQNNEGD